MAEWELAQSHPSVKLTELQHFLMAVRQAEGEIECRVEVKEFIGGEDQIMRFHAETNSQTNQRAARFTFCGWGSLALKALDECIQAIHRFPCKEDA